ncbi:hypothetical protein ACFLIM_38590 [Nonomuraea sp. M3C6]|uniref:DUF4352 domain-containing protein n=1 Tax=Nonomuraea marmarensis TaxID=3351344 RepID=A0ABW7ANY5_9ACTN
MMPSRRPPGTYPDQQVWPPAPYGEPANGATQPLPAVPGTGATSPNPGPRPPSPAFAPPPPPENPAPAEQAPPPRRPRTLLLGVGAVAAFVLAVGAPTADQYLFYKSGQPDDILHVVPAGQEQVFEHLAWKSSIAPMEPVPAGTTPDKQWLKITITRKATDDTGTKLTAKPELELRDKQERAWKVEVTEDNVAIDDGQVGKPYTYIAGAVVPKAVAGEVELHLRPDTTYRSDTPTEKLFEVPTDPAEIEKAKHKDVLVFRR